MTLNLIERNPTREALPASAVALPHRSHDFPARVAVTGADGFVGRALMLRLGGMPSTVCALVREVSPVRGLRVVTGPLDGLAAQSALGRAECIVHLAGGLLPRHGDSLESANVATARAVAQAVRGTGVRRIVYLSYVLANHRSHNRYLAAKAAAEQELQATGCDVIVLRCTHIVGPPEAPGPFASAFLARRGRPVLVIGNGSQLLAPVLLADVLTAIVLAMGVGRPGVYDLAGPDLFDLDGFVAMLNGPEVRLRHLAGPIAKVLGPLLPGLSRELVDVLLHDSVGEPGRALPGLAPRLTSLRDMW